MSLSQGLPSYNLTFHQISSLIYDKRITSRLVNIKSLQKYSLTSLDPPSILNKHLQGLLQQGDKNNPYNHEVSKEVCEKLWRQIVIKRNIYIGIIKFFSLLTTFLAPIMLDVLTTLFKQTSSDYLDHDKNLGWIYCAILISNNFFGLILETQYQFQVNRLKYEAKTVLQYLIYNKLTKLQVFGSENEPPGSQKIQANVNNLATIDTETIVGFFLNVHQTWSSFVSLCVVIVILFFKLRTALPIGLGMVIFLIWLSSRFVKVIGRMYSDVMKVKDKRIDLTSDVIKSIKAIKYLGWEHVFQKKIQDLRDEEFSYLSKIKYTDVFCILLWTVTSVTIVTITFLTFNSLGEGHNLHETNVFTIIAYFQMLINPLNSLPWTIGFIYQGSISFKRLKSFLDSKQSLQPQNPREPTTYDDNSIILRCDRITWPNNQRASDFELKDIRLNVNKGELVMVIGGVSSGKSALLNAILGEMRFYGDHRPRIIQGSIAYVPQTPWLQKNTIRENILFGKGYNKQLYEECIQICNLEKEIDELPGKDHYDVGPDGINLSGGQRQRISLCRALYQNADIYLLDDILSSVDANVANVIYQKAIMGFLRKRDKTVILVLSQYKYLNNATQVWLMSEGQLIKDQEAIDSYLKNYNEENKTNENQSISSLSDLQNIPQETEKTTHEETENRDQQGPEINIEEQERGEIKFKSIKLYISSMGYSIFIFIFLTAFIMQASRAFYDFWLKSYLQASSQNQTPALFIRSFETTLIVLTLSCYLTSSLRAFTFAFGNLKAARNLFRRLVPKVLYAKMTFFDKTSLGKILQRFSGDTFSLDDGVPFNWNMLLNNLTIFVGSMYIMVAQLPLMLFVIVPIMGVFYVLQRHFRRISREIKRLDSVYTGVIYTHLSETSEGLKIIRAFKKEKFMIDSFLNKIKLGFTTKSLLETVILLRFSQIISKMNLWLAVRIRSLSTLMITVLLGLAMYSKYYTKSGLDFNDFSLALMYAIANPVNFEDIIGALTAVEREFIGVERIGQFIENETEEEESENAQKVSQKTKEEKAKNKELYSLIKEEEPSQSSLDLELANTEGFRQEQLSIPKETVISFQNVSLSYLPEASGRMKRALKNISFEVKKNQKIALCGRTGSGKTTILNCLIRLYEIDQGQIFFMGNNIRNMSRRNIRSSVAVIPQFGFMCEGTLRENLDPMGVIPRASLLKVLEKGKELITNHSVTSEGESPLEESHEKIFNPDFYVEKNGRNLSSGERQIINFLRVLLQKPEVVFLDEATSNIDPNTDIMLQKSIFELCKDKTLITITHRLNYLEHYDQVIVLDDGEIVEMGKYQDLMAKENGKLQSFMKENQSVC